MICERKGKELTEKNIKQDEKLFSPVENMNRRQDIYFFLSYSMCSVITSYKNMPCESKQTGKFLKKWEYQIILSAS